MTLAKALGYHWGTNAHVSFAPTTDLNAKRGAHGFTVHARLLGFGFHFHREGDYVISGINLLVLHLGLQRIETTG
jgi:hypothetical protein